MFQIRGLLAECILIYLLKTGLINYWNIETSLNVMGYQRKCHGNLQNVAVMQASK
jgi:hypothetical protein